jgi:hypothetical protein
MHMSLEYLAGIIDGEGSLCISKHGSKKSIYARVAVVNTHQGLINTIHQQFGGNVCFRKGRNAFWKTAYIWQISNRKAIDLLRLVHPFLIVKKLQAELIFQMSEVMPGSYSGKRWESHVMDNFITAMKRLNNRNNYKGNRNGVRTELLSRKQQILSMPKNEI